MSTETQKVDVLAVLEKHHGRLAFGPRPKEADEMAEVRAAVVELIEAAQIALNYLPENGLSRERLSTALACFGGVA